MLVCQASQICTKFLVCRSHLSFVLSPVEQAEGPPVAAEGISQQAHLPTEPGTLLHHMERWRGPEAEQYGLPSEAAVVKLKAHLYQAGFTLGPVSCILSHIVTGLDE
jgi:hypothetical protein